jgi:serine protease Do
MDSKLAKSFGLPDAKGALVHNVIPASAADKAGLRAGDVITGIEGEDIAGPSDLISKLYAKSPNDRISLSVVREKRKLNVDVVLQSIDEVALARAATAANEPAPTKSKLNLGLTFGDITPDQRAQLDVSAPKEGPILLGVKPGGAAEGAGLRVGDIILQAGEKKVPDAEALNQVFLSSDMKKGIRIFFWRDGVTMYCVLQKS